MLGCRAVALPSTEQIVLVCIVTKYDTIETFTKILCQIMMWIIRIISGLLFGLVSTIM